MKFYIQWNIVNWITIVLMAAIGMLIFGAVASGIRQFAPGNCASDGDND